MLHFYNNGRILVLSRSFHAGFFWWNPHCSCTCDYHLPHLDQRGYHSIPSRGTLDWFSLVHVLTCTVLFLDWFSLVHVLTCTVLFLDWFSLVHVLTDAVLFLDWFSLVHVLTDAVLFLDWLSLVHVLTDAVLFLDWLNLVHVLTDAVLFLDWFSLVHMLTDAVLLFAGCLQPPGIPWPLEQSCWVPATTCAERACVCCSQQCHTGSVLSLVCYAGE